MRGIAITRAPGSDLASGERSYIDRAPIDLELAARQHCAYVDCLLRQGLAVEMLDALPGFPDAVFVEDVAVVLAQSAVITRPGAPSRRGEVPAVAAALSVHRPTHALVAPATLDGGDVLLAGARLFVGRTARTNPEGIEALRAIAAKEGVATIPVEVRGCLHFKSACARVGEASFLVNPAWIPSEVLGADAQIIEVHPDEPYGANVLWLGGDVVLCARSAPRTNERLAAAGLAVEALDISEIEKAEAGLTCMSLVFDAP